MALHGTIAVNREEIARWKAVRQTELLGYGAEHEYLWEYHDLQSRRTVTGRLEHPYDAGAAALASAILAAAAPDFPAPTGDPARV